MAPEEIAQAGVYDLPKAAYERDPCPEPSLRSSIAWKLVAPGSTPAHAAYECKRLNPAYEAPRKKHFVIGDVAHQLLLGRGAGYRVVRNVDDYKTKAAREARDEAVALGLTPLLPHEEHECMSMVKAARVQMRTLVDAGTIKAMPFEHPETERVLIWQEGTTWCRAALDGLSIDAGILSEFKTEGESADPEVWHWKARRLGYPFKATFYTRGLDKLQLAHSPEVHYFVLETKPPYLLSFVRLDPDLIAHEWQRVQRAIKIWRTCLASGTFPGYSTAGYDLTLTERERAAQEQAPYVAGGHLSSEDIAAGL